MPKPMRFPVKKLVPLTADLARRIAAFRAARRIRSDNEAIRCLIARGLAREEHSGAKEQP